MTPNSQQDKMRAEFEDHLTKTRKKFEFSVYLNKYIDKRTQRDWEVWQASRAVRVVELPDHDQLANELHSTKTTLEAITALLNPNDCTGLSLVELLQQRLAEAACDGFQAGFDASGECFNGEWLSFDDQDNQTLKEMRDHWLVESGYRK